MYSKALMEGVDVVPHTYLKFVEISEETVRLICVVAQAVEEFITEKNLSPHKVFLSIADFDLKGEVLVCGYKVYATPYIPKGCVVVTDEKARSIF